MSKIHQTHCYYEKIDFAIDCHFNHDSLTVVSECQLSTAAQIHIMLQLSHATKKIS